MRFGRAKEKSFPGNHVSLISYSSLGSVCWVSALGSFQEGGLQGNSPSLEIDTQWYLSSFCLISHPPGYNSAHRWGQFKANWSVSKGFMPGVFSAIK